MQKWYSKGNIYVLLTKKISMYFTQASVRKIIS